jgi:DNA-binding response OmpR family regulator
MKTILVVEDDRSLARLVQINLEAEGYRVSVCHEGDGAMAWLRQAAPDLVLLDLRLPTPVSGWDLLAYLRQAERLRRVPVVVVSAYAHTQDRSQAESLGASEYIVKPFGIVELLRCVARWAGTGNEAQA